MRTLIQLMESGSPNGDEGGGALYTGGNTGWVRSATTISTPHNGTTLRDVIIDYVPKVSELAGQIVEVAGLGGSKATEQGSFCCNNTDRLIAPFQSSSYQYARGDMIFFLKPTAGEWVVPSILQRGMGSYTQTAAGRVATDSSWFANDGVVNTISMRAPSGQAARDFDGSPVRGTWNYLGYYNHYDHFDVLGWLLPSASVYPIYNYVTSILYGL